MSTSGSATSSSIWRPWRASSRIWCWCGVCAWLCGCELVVCVCVMAVCVLRWWEDGSGEGSQVTGHGTWTRAQPQSTARPHPNPNPKTLSPLAPAPRSRGAPSSCRPPPTGRSAGRRPGKRGTLRGVGQGRVCDYAHTQGSDSKASLGPPPNQMHTHSHTYTHTDTIKHNTRPQTDTRCGPPDGPLISKKASAPR